MLICWDRIGQTVDFILDKAEAAHMSSVLKPIIALDSILGSDGSKALASSSRTFGLSHRPVNLAAGIRCIPGVYHVEHVNACDSGLKAWMRRLHGIATDYIANYLGWRRLIERLDYHPAPPDILRASMGFREIQQVNVT